MKVSKERQDKLDREKAERQDKRSKNPSSVATKEEVATFVESVLKPYTESINLLQIKIHTLSEILVQKGVLTEEELNSHSMEIIEKFNNKS